MLYPGVPYSIFMEAYDTHNNFSQPSSTVTGTAAEPDPSNTLYNPGFEIRSGYDLTLPDGWLVTLGGGGTVQLSTTSPHGGVRRVEFNCSSGVGGTSASIKSRFIRAQAFAPHHITAWAKGSAAGNVLTMKVRWYDAALALISTTTILTNQAITTAYNQYGGTAFAPANTVAMKIEIAHNVAGSSAVMHVDDVVATVNPPTDFFYNGSFEISRPNPILPDGWTIEGAGVGILWDTPTRDGNLAYKVTLTGVSDTLTTTSTPMRVTEGIPYLLFYSLMWDQAYLNGTDVYLIWLDESGATVSSTFASGEFGASLASYADRAKGPFIAPATATAVKLQFICQVASTRPINIYIDAVDVRPDLTGATIRLIETTAPGTPASGFQYLYPKSTDGVLYTKNSAGVEVALNDPSAASDILANQVFR
jgi:hypothetical protein